MGVEASIDPDWIRWLESALDDRAVRIETIPNRWGTRTTTARVSLRRHGALVVQGSRHGAQMRRRRRVAERLAGEARSLRVPQPLASGVVAGWTVVASEWLDGTLGDSLLDKPAHAQNLAQAIGSAAAAIRAVPAVELGLATGWARADILAPAIHGWLADVRDVVPAREWALVRDLSSSAADVAASESATLAHGDLVPVNLLVTATGVGVIDFEAARIAPVSFDAAHAERVIGHYHPDAWRLMEAPLFDAAGLPNGTEARARRAALSMAVAAQRASAAVRAGAPSAAAQLLLTELSFTNARGA